MPSLNFDATGYTPQERSYGVIPPGKYPSVINATDIKATRAGDGQYLEIELQIIDGQYAGRRIWERLNINNPNKKAEDIARERLAGLCQALGIETLTDSDQLLDGTVLMGLELDRKEPDRNRVSGFWVMDGATPISTPAAPAAAAPAAGKKPWQK